MPKAHTYDIAGKGKKLQDWFRDLKKSYSQCRKDLWGRYRVDDKGRRIKDGEFKRTYPRPCGLLRCPCDLCRQYWAKKEGAILAKSFESLPITHFGVLRSDTWTSPKSVWQGLSKFLKKLNREAKVHYHLRLEPDDTLLGYHVHILSRCETLPRHERLTLLLQRACESQRCSVHWEPARSQVGSAWYVVKFWLDKVSKSQAKLRTPWLPGADCAGQKLQQTSDYFLATHPHEQLTRPYDILWELVKIDWLAEREVAEITDDGPVYAYTMPEWYPLDHPYWDQFEDYDDVVAQAKYQAMPAHLRP